MLPSPSPERTAEIRSKLHAYIRGKLKGKEPTPEQIDDELSKTAKQAKSVHLATHIVKGGHSKASGTAINALHGGLPQCEEIGTHSLGEDLELDTGINNADQSGVYPFLRTIIDANGTTLLEALRNEDPDALAALHDDEAEARRLREALSLEHSLPPAVSHTRAKQIYWFVNEDLERGFCYHLLAPLYPSSLIHRMYAKIESAYDKESTELREAKRNKKYHAGVIHDYPGLVIHQVVASHPENVSHLIKEQRGKSYLLSSAPPHWRSTELRPPYHCQSVFDHALKARIEFRKALTSLRRLLKGEPPKIRETRRSRDDYVDTLIGELIQMADDYHHGLPAGWSRAPKVNLSEDEYFWLDPYRARMSDESIFRIEWMKYEWVDAVAERFARWLNAELDDLPVGDVEYQYWKRAFLKSDFEAPWAKQLYEELKASNLVSGGSHYE